MSAFRRFFIGGVINITVASEPGVIEAPVLAQEGLGVRNRIETCVGGIDMQLHDAVVANQGFRAQRLAGAGRPNETKYRDGGPGIAIAAMRRSELASPRHPSLVIAPTASFRCDARVASRDFPVVQQLLSAKFAWRGHISLGGGGGQRASEASTGDRVHPAARAGCKGGLVGQHRVSISTAVALPRRVVLNAS